jgi:hypothetical protein
MRISARWPDRACHAAIWEGPFVMGTPGYHVPAMPPDPFVPAEFVVPTGLVAAGLRLEPLGPQHNVADREAWTSSIDHIRATPGYEGSSWPSKVMSLDENLADLERHASDFAARIGFTYTVLDADAAVIGCVYIYPARRAGHDADVRSWVRASHAELDATLYRAVRDWLADAWPFRNPWYAVRPGADAPRAQ